MPGQHRVDAVDDLAVDLVGRVEPLQRLADQHEILGILERTSFGGRLRSPQPPARHRKLAPARLCITSPFGGGAACRLDLPLLRGGLHQHGARAGAGRAQRLPERPDRSGAAGRLNAEQGIGVKLVIRRRVLRVTFEKSASSSSARIIAIAV
jgi:hypothetical protein